MRFCHLVGVLRRNSTRSINRPCVLNFFGCAATSTSWPLSSGITAVVRRPFVRSTTVALIFCSRTSFCTLADCGASARRVCSNETKLPNPTFASLIRTIHLLPLIRDYSFHLRDPQPPQELSP